MIGIYKITCLIDGKVYIGQSINLKQRLQQHKSQLKKNKHFNYHLQCAYNKYGADNFIFEVIAEYTAKQLNDMETYWRDYYYPNIYNLGNTGNVGTVSEETKQKISKSVHETISKLTDEERKAKFYNPGSWRPGHHHSPEVIAKISKSLKGKPAYQRTEKIRLKCQLSSPNKKAVNQYDREGHYMCSFLSLAEAGRKLNLNSSNINSCCRRKYRTYHNFIFRYDFDDEFKVV